MKTLALLLLLTPFAWSQKLINSLDECSSVTRRFIAQHYSPAKQLNIENSSLELSKIEYMCAHSFELVSGQMVLRSQRDLIDVSRYENLRRTNVRVIIYDDYSGLQLVLYSWDEINQNLANLSHEFQMANK